MTIGYTMVLHNNYYIDDTEKINFFRYENLENFDLASSITEKIQFNNDLLLKLENVDWTLQDICSPYVDDGTMLVNVNNFKLKFRVKSSDTFLTLLIFYIGIGKEKNYLENIEKLYKSPDDVHYFSTSQKLKDFYDNNIETDFINFLRIILSSFFYYDKLQEGTNSLNSI